MFHAVGHSFAVGGSCAPGYVCTSVCRFLTDVERLKLTMEEIESSMLAFKERQQGM